MVLADILVIGGGIAGISAGARAAQSGAKVIVLERETRIGTHATGRSAAIFIANYGNATLRALNAASGPILAQPDDISDIPVLTPRGVLTIAGPDELDALHMHALGSVGLDHLSPAQALGMVPILRADRLAAASYEADAQDIDVDLVLNGFARLLRRHGGQIVCDAQVQAIAQNGDWSVFTAGETYVAPIVVNAAGAWGDVIAGMAGVRPVGLMPMRRSAAILPPPAGLDVSLWPLIATATERWYAKPMGGRLMVSPADEDLSAPHDAWPDDMVLAEGLDRFAQDVTMPVHRVERSWAGLRSFVADRTLVAGFAPDAPGFFWLVGQGGYGVQTSPVMAQLTADLCLGRAAAVPAHIVDALAPDRLFSN